MWGIMKCGQKLDNRWYMCCGQIRTQIDFVQPCNGVWVVKIVMELSGHTDHYLSHFSKQLPMDVSA